MKQRKKKQLTEEHKKKISEALKGKTPSEETVRYNQTYAGRKKILKKYGWKLIVLWESDLRRKDASEFVLSELGKYGVTGGKKC